MKLAIQEAVLPGTTTLERYQAAQQAGLAGVELAAAGLPERLLEVAAALDATGLQVASIHMGTDSGWIAPEFTARQAAIRRLQSAMTCAADLRCAAVIFWPQAGDSGLPDLTPFRSQPELEWEMYIWFLRTVNDLATALGVVIAMQPVSRAQSSFLHTIGQAVQACEAIQRHPGVRIAPHLYHMAQSEDDGLAALAAGRDRDLLYSLHLSDSAGRLPTGGPPDMAQVLHTLAAGGWSGWLTLSATAPVTATELAASVEYVRRSGLKLA